MTDDERAEEMARDMFNKLADAMVDTGLDTEESRTAWDDLPEVRRRSLVRDVKRVIQQERRELQRNPWHLPAHRDFLEGKA